MRVGRRRVEAGAVGLVGVGLEQPRAARPERAVDLTLDGANGQVARAVVDHPVLREPRRFRLVPLVHHHPEPDPEGPLVHHLLHQLDRRERSAGVLKAGDPFRARLAIRELENLARTRGAPGRRGFRLLDQTLRRLAQQPGRLAGRIPEHFSSRRALRDSGEARNLHRFPVGKDGMAARVGEHHRVARRHAIERRVRRKPFDVRRRCGRSISPGASPARGSTARAARFSPLRRPARRSRPTIGCSSG